MSDQSMPDFNWFVEESLEWRKASKKEEVKEDEGEDQYEDSWDDEVEGKDEEKEGEKEAAKQHQGDEEEEEEEEVQGWEDFQPFDPRLHTVITKHGENSKYFSQRKAFRPLTVIDATTIPKPPPKEPYQGFWKFSIYVPEWTDPAYVDQSLTRGDDQVLRRTYPLGKSLRPAQLAQDNPQNPTRYAKRFGIYPGRTDGRSRTSPTEEVRFHLPIAQDGSANLLQATEVASLFTTEAARQNLTADELFEKLMDPATYASLKEEEKLIVDLAEQLRADQDWQSVLFHDLTTDELKTAGIFEIDDEYNPGEEIDDEIDPLFERRRWATTFEKGAESDDPKVMYNVNGRRGEWNMQKDDWLWDRMQPMLRLLSKMWCHARDNDPYWQGLLNPFNREAMKPGRDPRPSEEKRNHPARTWTFRTTQDEKERLHTHATYLDSNIDGRQMTLQTLYRTVRWHVTSASHHGREEPTVNGPGIAGTTHNVRIIHSPPAQSESSKAECEDGDSEDYDGPLYATEPGAELDILISADFLYPLIQPGYSASEKVMANFIMASTILHELAHAVGYAQRAWLDQPGPVYWNLATKGSDLYNIIRNYSKWLFGAAEADTTELFFENEVEPENGYSAEQHMFGGCAWTVIGPCASFLDHLACIPSGLAFSVFPESAYRAQQFVYEPGSFKDAYDRRANLTLKTPLVSGNLFKKLVQWRRIAQLFTKDFWDTQVPRFGPSALLISHDPSSKIVNIGRFEAHSSLWKDELEKDASFSNDEKKKLEELPKHCPLVRQFLELLMIERYHFFELTERIVTDFNPLLGTIRTIGLTTSKLNLLFFVCCTASNYRIQSTKHAESSPKLQQLRHDSWKRYEALVARHDLWLNFGPNELKLPWPLPALTKDIEDETTFWANIGAFEREALMNINPLCKRGQHLVQDLIAPLELMLAEIWQLSDEHRHILTEEMMENSLFNKLKKHLPVTLRNAKNLSEVFVNSNPGQTDEPGMQATKLTFDILTEKLANLVPYIDNICGPPPDKWADRLSLVPNLCKSRRPTSARWLAMAKTEIGLLSVHDASKTAEIIKLIQRPVEVDSYKVHSYFERAEIDPTPIGDLTLTDDVSLGKDDFFQSGTINLTEKAQSLKRRHEDDEDPRAKRTRIETVFGLKSLLQDPNNPISSSGGTGPQVLVHPGPHFGTLQDLSMPGHEKWNRRRPTIPSLKFAGTSFEQSSRGGSPFVSGTTTPAEGPSPWQGNHSSFPESSQPPFGTPVDPSKAQQAYYGHGPGFPASIGIFPHPGAIQASTTMDLDLLHQHTLATIGQKQHPAAIDFQHSAFHKEFHDELPSPSTESPTASPPLTPPSPVSSLPGTSGKSLDQAHAMAVRIVLEDEMNRMDFSDYSE